VLRELVDPGQQSAISTALPRISAATPIVSEATGW